MHSIRLRGPWELHLPGSEPPLRIEMPATWQTLRAAAAESVHQFPIRLVRRFNNPTGIMPEDRLQIVIESAGAACEVELNGQPLGSIAPSRQSTSFEVTGLLHVRNELVLLLQPSSLGEGALTDVRLEIESPAGVPPSGGS